MRIDRDSIVSSGYIFRPFSLFRLPQNHTTKRKIKIKTKAKITEKNHTFISIFTTVTYGSEKHGVRTVTVLLRFISFCACFSFFIQCSVFSPKIRPIEQYIRTQRIVEKKKTHNHTHSTELKQNSRCIRHTSTIWECTHSTRIVLL